MNRKSKTILWIVLAVIAVLLVGMLLTNVIGGAKEISYIEFEGKLASGEITELYLDAYNWTGYVKDANGKVIATYTTVGPSVYSYNDFYGLMANIGFDKATALTVNFADPNAGSIWSSLVPILGIAVFALVFWLIMRSASGANNAAMNIGKS